MATFVVTGDHYRTVDRRMREIKRQLDQEKGSPFDPELVARALQQISEGKFGEVAEVTATAPLRSKPRLIHSMFTPPEGQIKLVQKWNMERNWGFGEKDFAGLGPAPQWSRLRLIAVVLEVCLDTIGQTFEELWAVARSRQPQAVRWDQLLSDLEHI